MNRRPTWAAGVIAVLAIGCGSDRPDVGSGSGPAPATGKPVPVSVAADAASPCPALVRRWEVALAAASLACTTDADCGCFNGGVSEQAGCGGVAAKPSVATLEAIRTEFLASCDMALQCAAWVCSPRCAEERCAR